MDAADKPIDQSTGPVLVREVAAAPVQASIVRTTLADWAHDHGLPAEMVDDLKIASYEAMANVVEHAYPDDEDATMTVVASVKPDALTVTITDGGRWESTSSKPDGGRGLHLIRAFAPEATITSGSTGTTVRLSWPYPP